MEVAALYACCGRSSDGLHDFVDNTGCVLRMSPEAVCHHFGYSELVNEILTTGNVFAKTWKRDQLLVSMILGVLFYNPDRRGLKEISKIW